jgi:hypothetical protein
MSPSPGVWKARTDTVSWQVSFGFVLSSLWMLLEREEGGMALLYKTLVHSWHSELQMGSFADIYSNDLLLLVSFFPLKRPSWGQTQLCYCLPAGRRFSTVANDLWARGIGGDPWLQDFLVPKTLRGFPQELNDIVTWVAWKCQGTIMYPLWRSPPLVTVTLAPGLMNTNFQQIVFSTWWQKAAKCRRNGLKTRWWIIISHDFPQFFPIKMVKMGVYRYTVYSDTPFLDARTWSCLMGA